MSDFEDSFNNLKRPYLDEESLISQSFEKKAHFGHKTWHGKISDWVCLIVLACIQAWFVFGASPHTRCIPAHKYSRDDTVNSNCTAALDPVNNCFATKLKSNCARFPDPNLDFARVTEQVSMTTLFLVCIGMFAFVVFTSYFINFCIYKEWLRDTLKETFVLFEALLRECLFVFFATEILNNSIKNYVGRPRPNYYHLSRHEQKRAKTSFPSGHAAIAFSVLTLLSLHLIFSFIYCQVIEHNASYTEILNKHNIHTLFFVSLFYKIRYQIILSCLICFIPIAVAVWIACTRLNDYFHHFADVIAGGLVGAFCALIGFYFYSFELYSIKPVIIRKGNSSKSISMQKHANMKPQNQLFCS